MKIGRTKKDKTRSKDGMNKKQAVRCYQIGFKNKERKTKPGQKRNE